MLFILYGGTLEMGYRCRCFFKEQGFDIIKKYNYISDDAPIDRSNYEHPDNEYAKWFDDKVYATKEEIDRCDFRYDLNGVHLGFNKQQILDAIHGKSDCIVTLAAASMKFVELMKRAYGDYVTVINLFIDHTTYSYLIQNQPGITPSEYNARMAAETTINQTYIDKHFLFDEIVLYTGDDTVFDFENLKLQFNHIIHKRRKIERKLNNSKYVELPYIGKEPYIFISYCHEDIEQVNPVLSMLQRNSFRVWYDDALIGGEDWRDVVSTKIDECDVFVLFASANAWESTEVGREIESADYSKKKIVVVALDDEPIISKYRMIINSIHRIAINDESFEQRLLTALSDSTRNL